MPYVTCSKAIDDMPQYPGGATVAFFPGQAVFVHESVRHFYVGNPDFTISETNPELGNVIVKDPVTGVAGLSSIPFSKRISSVENTIPGAVHGWWSGPLVYKRNDAFGNNSFIGAADEFGNLVTILYDHNTNAVRRKNIGHWEVDDHNVPAFTHRLDGRIVVAYARHALENAIRYRISETQNSDDWGTEQTIATSGTATYVQMFRQSSVIHLFYRVGASGAGGWAYRYSTDNAVTWTTERIVFDTEYVLVVPNQEDGASSFRCYGYQNPTSGTDHNIYYCSINSATGEIRANGSTVTGSANARTGVGCPVAMSSIQKAAEVDSSTVSTRLMGASVATSNFSFLAVEFTSAISTDGKLYRYSYSANNVVFTRKYICDIGTPFSISTRYHGGACFAYGNQDKVYVARNDAGEFWFIDEYSTADSGASWVKRNIYTGVKKVARPVVFGGDSLIFSEFDAYVSFEDFTNGVLRIVAI